jgi:hypothetical protein
MKSDSLLGGGLLQALLFVVLLAYSPALVFMLYKPNADNNPTTLLLFLLLPTFVGVVVAFIPGWKIQYTISGSILWAIAEFFLGLSHALISSTDVLSFTLFAVRITLYVILATGGTFTTLRLLSIFRTRASR